MIFTMEFLVGALVGAVIVLVVAWFVWGRNAARLTACQEQSKNLQAAQARLEQEVNTMKANAARLEEANQGLAEENVRLENEKATAQAVMLRAQSERSYLEGTVSRLQVEKASINADFDRIKFDNQKLRERLGQVEDALQAAEEVVKDDLTVVNGVNEALAYRMNRAGIRSLRELGSTPPQQIAELTGDSGSKALKLVLAARAAGGLPVDDLERIAGIGPVIARMLNNACIFTFAELGALTVVQLRTILGDRVQRLAKEESLLEQARKLAEESKPA